MSNIFDPAAPNNESAFPHLTDEQVTRACAFGTIEDVAKGTVLFERGERGVDFFLVLRGSIEIYSQGDDGEPRVFINEGVHQFTGELHLFSDRRVLVSGRMGEDGTILRMTRPQFRRMLQAETDIAEIIMRAFILRRIGLIENEQGAATVVGSPRSSHTLSIHRFLTGNGFPMRALDPTDAAQAAQARAFLDDCGLKDDRLPAVIWSRERVLIQPDLHELAEFLGISEPLEAEETYDVTIVGGGPAGLAAAVYAASEGLCTVVLESDIPGGQAGTSSRIENYLGFPAGISGQQLAGRAQVQAQKFGARIAVPRRVSRLEASDGQPFRLHLDDGFTLHTKTIIIATGARYRSLDIHNAKQFEGNGLHFAATNVEADLCRAEDVVVVGGGNSAGQAAVFLSRIARHVHLLVRGPHISQTMSEYLIERIEASSRISLRPRTEIIALSGDRHLQRVRWIDRASSKEEEHAIANVFLMLGAEPNTSWLGDHVETNDKGFILTDNLLPLETSCRGIFAVGDVRSGSIKRVAAAVGEGASVVASIHQRLATM